MITYYEFMVRNLTGCLMHPDTMASIEKVHYAVEHNLPLKRQVYLNSLNNFSYYTKLFQNYLKMILRIYPKNKSKLFYKNDQKFKLVKSLQSKWLINIVKKKKSLNVIFLRSLRGT